ncbi:hypothetical protein SASK131_06100 [Staphylococcus argenteus]|nr:hypothetical protein TMSFP064_06710 [Staphylococcus argenteus]BCN90296.1 hypothetical protein TMSFP069_06710 [Staphylococcus argenteus]GJF38420.1 hypothetical protein SA19056_06270 [Staphylococcus argenteus]GJF41384.1 hypothetical protein SA19059_10360 [Staphylococcus argenteus]GJF46386.1 hypothetical protein SA19080_09020 [Staphylococcus argenteus]
MSAFINVQVGGEGDGVSAFINVRVDGAPPARLTRIEKSLLQAHFHSVNYCQYNIIDSRTLIYVPACMHKFYSCIPIFK